MSLIVPTIHRDPTIALIVKQTGVSLVDMCSSGRRGYTIQVARGKLAYALWKRGWTQRHLAGLLKRDASTICAILKTERKRRQSPEMPK